LSECSKCGRPTTDGEELCGFCIVNKTRKEPIISSEKKIEETKSTEEFSKYDEVVKKKIKKKKVIDSNFAKYDVVTKAMSENEKSSSSTTHTLDNTDVSNKNLVSIDSPVSMAGIAIATLMFLIVLTVYGQVQATINTSVFDSGVENLINLIPLVLVGAIIIGIISVGFRLSNI